VKPERWEQIKDLFGLALEREPSQRAAFLQEACSDDEARAEVESLLASHEMAESAAILLNPLPSSQPEPIPDSQHTNNCRVRNMLIPSSFLILAES